METVGVDFIEGEEKSKEEEEKTREKRKKEEGEGERKGKEGRGLGRTRHGSRANRFYFQLQWPVSTRPLYLFNR